MHRMTDSKAEFRRKLLEKRRLQIEIQKLEKEIDTKFTDELEEEIVDLKQQYSEA